MNTYGQDRFIARCEELADKYGPRFRLPAAVLGMTALGLASVNMSEGLGSVLAEGQSTWPYWAQTGMIAGLWVILTVLYVKQSDT
ncbi:hypothetical protein [Mameliella sp.]|uniref:hypothetical protein n=1 Tax=Mameliella sp. TaxID=1924940 RepID=UPI003B50271E